MIGNCPAAAAAAAAEAARRVLTERCAAGVLPSELDRWRTVRLPERSAVALTMPCRNAADPNSAHLVLWQAARQADLRGDVLSQLLQRIVKRAAFHQLRTVEQIGYLVWTYETLRSEVPHFAFLLQSTKLGAAEIGERVAAFLQQWRGTFDVRS